jgi:predicted lipoprotein with Yx(FWY)xxD motif
MVIYISQVSDIVYTTRFYRRDYAIMVYKEIMMNRKCALAVVIAIVVLGAFGIYFKARKNSLTDLPRPYATTFAKKTTYQAAVSNMVFTTKSSSALGQYLTMPNAKALYTYKKDKKGISNCTTSCITNWPPYEDTQALGASLPANVSTILRTDDGMMQYTYKGLPLYTYVHDSNNKVGGNGVDGFELLRL